MIALFLIFEEICLPMSTPINISINSVCTRVSFSPHPCQYFVGFFDPGCSDRCEVIFHCDFDLHFPN